MDGEILFRILRSQRGSGLLRTAAVDEAFHAGLYIRVVMLVSAVLVGLMIVRKHSSSLSLWKVQKQLLSGNLSPANPGKPGCA